MEQFSQVVERKSLNHLEYTVANINITTPLAGKIYVKYHTVLLSNWQIIFHISPEQN